MTIRLYDAAKDKSAVHRIWEEVGWLDKNEKQYEAMDLFLSTSKAWVVELNNEAECLVVTTDGTIRHLKTDLPLCAVTGVTTSRVARKQGFAGRLTARAIADAAENGAMVAGLGIFDQGFYNLLGFGNGTYEHWIRFDPSTLKIDKRPRVPRRLSSEDWQIMHTCRLNRLKTHANCNLLPAEITGSEVLWTDKGFGLGYNDGPEGELSHYLWCKAKDENGPYSVGWYAYQTYDQLMELFALIKQLGDQVFAVSMSEPPGIQIQDLLKQPFRHRRISEKTPFENRMGATAYWQLRMLDIEGCLQHTHLPTGIAAFNLILDDPIQPYLDGETSWQGLSGDYIINLGEESSAKKGRNPNIPTLQASVGAFTRLWMGILPATSLALTDTLSGPPALLGELDWVLRLPTPKLGWDF